MIQDHLQTILSFILGVLGTGVCGSFYFRKQIKDNKELTNDNIVISQMQGVIDNYKQLNKSLREDNASLNEQKNNAASVWLKQTEDAKKLWLSEIDTARTVSNEKTEKINELYAENKSLMEKLDAVNSEVAKLKVTKCMVKGCPNRRPPSNY